ncbi:SixA phosphatase family protein [Algoriphagus namhaensis]
MKKIYLFLLLCFFFASCGSSPEPKTIYIVRHAEKQLTQDADPDLAVAGKARAVKLKQILEDKEIKHIFSTNYKRTRLTAQPTADQLGIQVETYDPRDQEAFAEKLKGLEGNILVVGHSNTAPRLANILIASGSPYPDLSDVEYDNIYILEYKENGFSAEVKTYKDF